MALLPKESAKLIASLAKDVKISTAGIKKVSDVIENGFKKEKYSIKWWKEQELNPKTLDKFAVDWIFFADTLNFSFWVEKGKKFNVSYKGKLYTGYWALCALMNRALEEGIPLLSADYCANVTLEELKHIFRTENNVEIPLMEERRRVLNETGHCLKEKFNGSFVNVLALCENKAQKLLKLVVENFPSYRDEAEIEGHRVCMYKRAQILIADIWSCGEGQGYGKFDDIDTITMFADYRIPQVLAYFGALEYSEDLLQKLKNDQILESGSRLEVEIRGCAIEAVEMVCKHLQEKHKGDSQDSDLIINAIVIDNYLWNYRRDHVEETDKMPFHKTRCIYY